MKVRNIVLSLVALVLLASCASVPKIAFDKLDSRELTLDQINFSAYVSLEGMGITINTSLLADKEKNIANIKQMQIKKADGTVIGLPTWDIDFESTQPNRVSINFIIPPDGNGLKVEAEVKIYQDKHVVNSTTFTTTFYDWAIHQKIVDRTNAATLRFGRNIQAQFINGEMLGSYEKNNSVDKKAIFMTPNEEYTILYKINDP